MNKPSLPIYTAIAMACIIGLIWWWPLCALSLVVLVYFGYAAAAIATAIFLDVVYGVPPYFAHQLTFPFTALIVVLIIAWMVGERFMRRR